MLKTRVPALISCALALAAIAAAQKPATIARYTRFEAEFTSSTEYVNPIQEANLEVEFTSAGGDRQTVQGFWDGEKTWKVRFSPENGPVGMADAQRAGFRRRAEWKNMRIRLCAVRRQ